MYPQTQTDSPALVWRRFAIWGVLALIALVALGRLGPYTGLLVLGWAFGMVVCGSLILFRQGS